MSGAPLAGGIQEGEDRYGEEPPQILQVSYPPLDYHLLIAALPVPTATDAIPERSPLTFETLQKWSANFFNSSNSGHASKYQEIVGAQFSEMVHQFDPDNPQGRVSTVYVYGAPVKGSHIPMTKVTLTVSGSNPEELERLYEVFANTDDYERVFRETGVYSISSKEEISPKEFVTDVGYVTRWEHDIWFNTSEGEADYPDGYVTNLVKSILLKEDGARARGFIHTWNGIPFGERDAGLFREGARLLYTKQQLVKMRKQGPLSAEKNDELVAAMTRLDEIKKEPSLYPFARRFLNEEIAFSKEITLDPETGLPQPNSTPMGTDHRPITANAGALVVFLDSEGFLHLEARILATPGQRNAEIGSALPYLGVKLIKAQHEGAEKFVITCLKAAGIIPEG